MMSMVYATCMGSSSQTQPHLTLQSISCMVTLIFGPPSVGLGTFFPPDQPVCGPFFPYMDNLLAYLHFSP
jgi:hypothetical protein